ncbi:hypothetical protein QF026_000168 [Streptomyces aurantiacus]|nr:hypothetical protein [Streptomyces aurantiacus]
MGRSAAEGADEGFTAAVVVRGAHQFQTGARPDPVRHVVGRRHHSQRPADARFILKAE